MKISVHADQIWLIRILSDSRIDYWSCRRISNAAPTGATWFLSRDAAEHTIYDIKHEKNFYHFDTNEYSIVSLEEAMKSFIGAR